MRKRALDFIDFSKEKWLRYNPLFKSYIKELDESFNRGTPFDLNYYVERFPEAEPEPEKLHETNPRGPVSFEDRMCNYLFSPNPTGKIYVLAGAVGSGKTSFSRFLAEKKLPAVISGSLSIYIDTYKIFFENGNEEQFLERILSAKIKNALLNGTEPIFSNDRELYVEMLKIKGFTNCSSPEIFQFEEKLTLEKMLDFLNVYPKISHLLVIFDNMDEDSVEIIEKCQSFALFLMSTLRDRKGLNSCILIPVRKYTVNNLFNVTERYAVISLPSVNEVKIVKSKLDQAADLIARVVKDFAYTVQGIDNTKFEVIIDKGNSLKFFKELTEHLLSTKEPEVLELIRGLSGGNLKILTANMYNLLHSAKLPLIPLYKKIIFPKDTLFHKSRYILPFDLACECLIAIHYPFYDHESSHIINIFNANSQRNGPVEYQNTLVIFRIICTLVNTKEQTYEKLIELFDEIGYSQTYLDDGLKKCLSYGLITSNHGLDIIHFEKKTRIQNSECVKIYLEKLIFEPSYLQYICEDVPMPPEYLISIFDKYSSEETPGCKEKRLQGVEKFIQFIEREEDIELEYVKKFYKHDVKDFLETMSLNGTRISELLTRQVPEKLRRIKLS